MTTSSDVLLYVQHLLGIGHLRRAALIARALDRAGLSVTLVSGGLPLPGLDIGGARLVQLPPLRASDAAFSALVDAEGQVIDHGWKAARRDQLLSVFHETHPRALITELFPFGRRQLRFELLPLLEAAKAATPRPWIASSVRDVLNPITKPEKTTWILNTLTTFYDCALIHGDPAFVPFETSFPEVADITVPLHYTGYVTEVPPANPSPRPSDGEVLVSAGGGAVAGPLIEACLAARPLSPLADRPWRLLLGHNFPETDFQAICREAPSGMTIERARSDFRQLLQGCALSISQGGYNTLLEVLNAGPPAVVVPFVGAGEAEQTLRAARLAQEGWLSLVEERTLSGQNLAEGIARALKNSPQRHATAKMLNLEGAEATARLVAEELARRAE